MKNYYRYCLFNSEVILVVHTLYRLCYLVNSRAVFGCSVEGPLLKLTQNLFQSVVFKMPREGSPVTMSLSQVAQRVGNEGSQKQ